MGVILLDNSLRKESGSVIEALKAQGIETHLLTSDTQQSVEIIATQLGVEAENTDAQVLPKQKIEVIRRLHNAGKTVAYVADELNDTEALAYADVSISFAKGTDLEGETADVVLLDNDLKGVIHAIAIAKQAMEIVYQNIAIVAVPNISVVLAGVFLGLDPIAAVIINNCAALIAEMNGRRLLFSTESE